MVNGKGMPYSSSSSSPNSRSDSTPPIVSKSITTNNHLMEVEEATTEERSESELVKLNAKSSGPNEACGGGEYVATAITPTIDTCNNKQDKQDMKNKVALTKDDFKRLLREYDDNGDGEMSDDEIARLLQEYRDNKITNTAVREIIEQFDTNSDGDIDVKELSVLKEGIDLNQSKMRFAGYSVSFTRILRYLAFGPEFGEALTPMISPKLVTGLYLMSVLYIGVDVGWEAYKTYVGGYHNSSNGNSTGDGSKKEGGKRGYEMSTTQKVVERGCFQLIASMAVPSLVVSTGVNTARYICRRFNRFQRLGPPIVGLSIIPFLPLYVDQRVERLLGNLFDNYGPWKIKKQ